VLPSRILENFKNVHLVPLLIDSIYEKNPDPEKPNQLLQSSVSDPH
jgi:hypothetical protein